MWHLIFLFSIITNLMSIIYPFLIKFDMRLNVLRLKGSVKITIFNKFNFQIKFRIKNGYIYIYFNKKERKEQLTNKNINLVFIGNIIGQFYYRQQVLNVNFNSNFGYNLDSCVTATGSGYIDVLSKCFLSKIKNNKKSSNIFIFNQPKYNEDICNMRLVYEIRMSVVDIIYAFVYAIKNTWSEYENRKSKFKRKQKN